MRFIQLYHRGWDQHNNLPGGIKSQCHDTDQPTAALLGELTTQPFDLARGPLHRIALLRLGEDDHVLLWLIHHAVGDLWSAMILLREFTAMYNAALHGRTVSLPASMLTPAFLYVSSAMCAQ